DLLRVPANQRGVALERLVRREHIVVGRDDPQVRRALGVDAQLVLVRQYGRGVGHVGAAQAGALRTVRALRGPVFQVGAARGRTAFDDAPRDAIEDGVQAVHGLRST